MKKLVQKVLNSKRTKKYLWSLTGRPQYAISNGVKINLRSPAISDRVAKSLYLGLYERLEARVVCATLSEDDRVLELGSGIGYLSTLCARRIGSDRVCAVEANPDMEKHIRETYRLNDVSPALEMCVLGNTDGEISFHVNENYSSSSLHDRGGKSIQVRQRSFSGMLATVCPTYLICDIEGGEVPLLIDTPLDGVKKICIEIHPHIIGNRACSQLVQKLLAEGFDCDWKISGGYVFYFYRDESRPAG